MKIVPQYAFDPGTQVSLRGRELIIAQVTANGYEVIDAERQTIEVISCAQWMSYLKMPGTAIEYVQGPLSAAQARLGELISSANGSEASQQEAMFRFSLCTAMRLHEQQLRDEYGDPSFHLSNNKMNAPENRKSVRSIAQALFGQRIYLHRRMGEKHKHWGMKSGRCLMDDYRVFLSLPDEVDPLDFLVPLNHKKEKPRLKNLISSQRIDDGSLGGHRARSNAAFYLERVCFPKDVCHRGELAPRT